jgi:UTP-glucose-1-phosphate uridylyltransferase
VKAVIIAGGFGTRLRPLSCTRPKQLFPIGGRPLLDWTLERLSKCGVDTVVFAVNYLFNAFVDRYGESAYGMKLRYSKEAKSILDRDIVRKAMAVQPAKANPLNQSKTGWRWSITKRKGKDRSLWQRKEWFRLLFLRREIRLRR